MTFTHIDETLFEDGISFATASNKQQAYHLTIVLRGQAERIASLEAENARLQAAPLSAIAFEYTDTETGESIPVPFSEVIKHHKQTDADLFVAKETIASLEAENAAYKQACENMSPERLTAFLAEYTTDVEKLRPYSDIFVAGDVFEGAVKHVEALQAERDDYKAQLAVAHDYNVLRDRVIEISLDSKSPDALYATYNLLAEDLLPLPCLNCDGIGNVRTYDSEDVCDKCDGTGTRDETDFVTDDDTTIYDHLLEQSLLDGNNVDSA